MASQARPDSGYSWLRLAAALLAATIGGVGMWSMVVILPAIQTEFGVDRAGASIPATLTMLGFGLGGIVMGRLADRRGVAVSSALAGVALCVGYLLASRSASLWQFALVHGALIGMLGTGACFGPLMADISHWFDRRRGLAVAVTAAGNYVAGTVWPPVVQHIVQGEGWRFAYAAIGIFCGATMLPLALLMRRPPPAHDPEAATARAATPASLGLSPGALQTVLVIAGVACCVAMAMPQVHIVAYCADLGYGVARGADMLSLMLGFGIVSRVGSGWIADRIGGLGTLLVGSTLQGVALLLYIGFNGLGSLYVISALFGLFQGGIVPSYAIIVREYFPASEAGGRVGVVIMATLVGMALGGWMSGAIFDWTGSYEAAFVNGLLWNLLNGAIATSLILRRRGGAGRQIAFQ